MHGHDPIEDLGLSCPYGGQFYICSNDLVRFIGCCSINPCGTRKGLCPDEHLKPASFEKEHQSEILPQACVNDNVDVSWYTCSGNTPAFLGCCAVNPCSKGGCPKRELRAAKLSDKTKNAETFLDGGPDYIPGYGPSGTGSGANPVSSLNVSSTVALSTLASSFLTSFTAETILGTTSLLANTPTSKPKDNDPGKDGRLCWLIPLCVVLPLTIIVSLIALCIRHKKKQAKRAREKEREEFFESLNRPVQPEPNPIAENNSETQESKPDELLPTQHDQVVQEIPRIELDAPQPSQDSYTAQRPQCAELDASQPVNNGRLAQNRPRLGRIQQVQQVQQHGLSTSGGSNSGQSPRRGHQSLNDGSRPSHMNATTSHTIAQQPGRNNNSLPSQNPEHGRYTRAQPTHLPDEPGRPAPSPAPAAPTIVHPQLPVISEGTGTPTSYEWPEVQRNLGVTNGSISRSSGSSEGSSKIAKGRRDTIGSDATFDSKLSDPLKKPRAACSCRDERCDYEGPKEKDEE
ncbi:hypothetical protein NW762_005312 [Fusarium torreyae]|uniref:Uncharacterized protein n=1 Tax=Fusarium torreyae TaxID=1237075 RepID=A0A9W8VFM9_9HYPO|nr:hypothetical protein NW762_005312 [Fusarium torreyae]